MLIKDLKGNIKPFEAYKELTIEQEINQLDIITFIVPHKYAKEFKNEYVIDSGEQFYTIKNIEPYYNDYLIEGKQDISDWQEFHKSLNFPIKNINTIINGIIPAGWQLILLDEINEKRTITADHKSGIEIIEELKKKFGVEIRLDNENKKIYVGYEIANDKGTYFAENINLIEKDIKMESFEFATRIVPEGMNGLKINQINNGLDYLEDKSYSDKTITYYWKDERYTNIQNLKNDAQKKLDELSKPYVTIETKVQDLSRAINAYNLELNLGDYVHLLDNDGLTNDSYRIVKIKKIENDPFNTEITLNNKLLDLVDDEDRIINLTNEIWENTRTRFEVTENSIKGFVETQKRYTDDSFKTYRSEREQTDKRIYEAITESTTYVDPKTGQTQPIIDKQLEIDKTLDGIQINILDVEKTYKETIEGVQNDMKQRLDTIDSGLSGLGGEVLAYKQDLDITKGKVNSEITTIRKEVDESENNVKEYLNTHYSSREQTDLMIKDSVGSIKHYVEQNYSTRTQTDSMIQSQVRGVKDTADEAYTIATQTKGEVSTKVGTKDVYSIMQQLPSYVKIDAKNIDLTGNVDVQGTFKTSSYGKRVEIVGNSIKFYDWSSFKGSLSIDDENIICLQGKDGYSTGYISMNKNLAKAPFRYLNSFYPYCWLGGDWGVVNLEAGEVRTMRMGVDGLLESYGLATFYKDAVFKNKIILDNVADIRTTSSGGQVWITQISSGLSFVIDYAGKKTYFA